MQIELGNPHLACQLSVPSGRWDLRSCSGPAVAVANARLGLTGSWRGAPFTWEGELAEAVLEGPHPTHSPIGEAKAVHLRVRPEGLPLQLGLEFVVPVQAPLVLWRLQAVNVTQADVQLDHFNLLRAAPNSPGAGHGGAGGVSLSEEAPCAFHLNGWQSWSYSGTLQAWQRQPRSLLGPLLRSRHEIPGVRVSSQTGRFVSDLYGVLLHPQRKAGLLAGFLGQRQMFGRVEARLSRGAASLDLVCPADGVILRPSAGLSSDWACLQLVDLTDDFPLDPFLLAVAELNGARRSAASPTGWCSWYQFFARVESEQLEQNIAWIGRHQDRYRLQVIQLDDGYQSRVGDWDRLRPNSGLSLDAIRGRMEEAGGIPGLWIAPLVAAHDSQVARDHPSWILRKPGGAPVGIGYTWGLRTRAFDVSHPGAREFISRTIATAVHSWGFRYLKLDFLYAGALIGERHDRSQTRAQAFSQVLREIRQAAGPDTHLLGCGGPLGPGIGCFDSMRVGPDVAVGWNPSYPGIPALPKRDLEFPAVRNALRSALNRAHLHRRWWVNDADCVLLRPAARLGDRKRPGVASRLTEAEAQTLLTVSSMLAGALIVSDHLPALPESRLDWLSRALPLLPEGARVLDWAFTDHPGTVVLSLSGAVGAWTLIASVNWGDREIAASLAWEDLRLNPAPGGMHAVDFWRSAYSGVHRDRLALGRIPPHGTAWVAVRPVLPQPAWLGDTLHVSQGGIVESWDADAASFTAELAPTHPASGSVWLAMPGRGAEISLDGAPVPARRVGQGVYCLEVAVSGRSVLVGRIASADSEA